MTRRMLRRPHGHVPREVLLPKRATSSNCQTQRRRRTMIPVAATSARSLTEAACPLHFSLTHV